MEKQCGGKVIGGLMRTKKKYIFEGRGSGGRKPKKSSKNSIATLISRRGGKGKEVTHEEIDEALERFLKEGGEIDVQPETWHNIHKSEKMLWGFEG
jgi:hypothetical protein